MSDERDLKHFDKIANSNTQMSVDEFRKWNNCQTDLPMPTLEKAKRKNEESQLQKKCVKLFRQLYPLYLLFSIPNGGNRNAIEAVNLKNEGVVSGVADLCLLFGNGGYYALFIEMKTTKGKQSENQIAFQHYCEKNKYKYVVCRSVEQFINEVNEYLK